MYTQYCQNEVTWLEISLFLFKALKLLKLFSYLKVHQSISRWNSTRPNVCKWTSWVNLLCFIYPPYVSGLYAYCFDFRALSSYFHFVQQAHAAADACVTRYGGGEHVITYDGRTLICCEPPPLPLGRGTLNSSDKMNEVNNDKFVLATANSITEGACDWASEAISYRRQQNRESASISFGGCAGRATRAW